MELYIEYDIKGIDHHHHVIQFRKGDVVDVNDTLAVWLINKGAAFETDNQCRRDWEDILKEKGAMRKIFIEWAREGLKTHYPHLLEEFELFILGRE